MSSTHLTTSHPARAGGRARAGARRARAARAYTDELWAPGDRLFTAVLIAVGVACIGIAWVGASNTTQWDTQLRWTALSLVGVVVVCVGVGIWLSRGFARVRVEARAVRRTLSAGIAPTIAADSTSGWARVTVAGMSHHHAPDCLLVTGKTTVAADEATLAPCGVCS
jgi:sulfite exporter TauE/SafE